MQRWEYKILTIDFDNNMEKTTRELNQLGEQGWELVANSGLTYFFKRPKK